MLACGVASAQTCNDAAKITTPQSRFNIGDLTVTDKQTGLVWQRCPAGYTLDNAGTLDVLTDDSCTATGTTAFTWQAALQHAEATNQAGGIDGNTDWRVPNIKELMSIVEWQCVSSAINEVVFPQPSRPIRAPFWSASNSNDFTLAARAYVLNFIAGNVSSRGDRSKDINSVRLVR